MNMSRARILGGTTSAVVGIFLGLAVTSGPGFVRPANAHPSVSLVQDTRGNLYFSDLESVRALRPDGSHDYGFGRDAVGNTYVLRRDSRSIEVRDAAGSLKRSVELGAGGGFVHWLTVEPGGRLHVAVGDEIRRIDPGSNRAQVVATELSERTAEFSWVHDRHALMGMWADDQGSVYVAVFAGQVVKKIDGSGEVTVIARSEGDWSPVRGRSGPDGRLHLLEWSNSNQVRIREIGSTGAERIFPVD